jgi:hypothetical protein
MPGKDRAFIHIIKVRKRKLKRKIKIIGYLTMGRLRI